MPRKPRKLKRKYQKTGLTTEMTEIHNNGYSFKSLLDGYKGSPFIDKKHQEDNWRQHRDFILSHYRDRIPTDDDENTYPSGTRPHAFWIFDRRMEQPPENQLAYLRKYDLLFPGELFQVRVNEETNRKKK